MKTNTVKYSVSIPDIHQLLELDDKFDIEPRLAKLASQGVRFQDPIAELEGKSIYDHFLLTNRSLSDIREFFASGLDFQGGRDSVETLAFKAAFKKRPEVFAWVIDDIAKKGDHSFDPNKLDYSDRASSFFIAASSNLNSSMSDLVDLGADITTKNKFGQTVLQNYLKLTRQLRKQTIDDLLDYSRQQGLGGQWLINEADNEGQTPIMTLLFRSNRRSRPEKEKCIRSLRFFLNNGANPSHQDNRGYSPLMWVAIEGDLDQMKILLDHGADANLHNHAGDSALTLSVIRGNKEAVRCLLEHGVNPNATPDGKPYKNPLLIACQNDSHEIAFDLLNYGAEPNIYNDHHDRHTPLIYAIKNGNRELAQKLLERGADPDLENNHGMTPLMYAVYNFRDNPESQAGIIEDLINSGASLTQKNHKGMTATQLVSELNLEIKIGNLMYERNLDYIAQNYFSGDLVEAKKHLVTENSDVFELLHSEKIESSDHMVTFMKEKSDHVRETKNESNRQFVKEGYRLITRAAFLVTPSVTAASTTVESLMKNNSNSVPLAATAGVATMAAYFLSHNTEDRKKIRMAIEDAKDTIDRRILTPLRDEMIKGYINASLYINEKMETLIGHWERVCDQFSKLGAFFDSSNKKKQAAKREDLLNELGKSLTDDQLVEIIDAIHQAKAENLDVEAKKIRELVELQPAITSESKNSNPKIIGVKVEDHNQDQVVKRLTVGSDISNDF